MAAGKPGTKTCGAKGRSKSTSAAPPWERPSPKAAGEHEHLSLQAKATAKRRARKAGRPYPNLVDNMRAAAGEKR